MVTPAEFSDISVARVEAAKDVDSTSESVVVASVRVVEEKIEITGIEGRVIESIDIGGMVMLIHGMVKPEPGIPRLASNAVCSGVASTARFNRRISDRSVFFIGKVITLSILKNQPNTRPPQEGLNVLEQFALRVWSLIR